MTDSHDIVPAGKVEISEHLSNDDRVHPVVKVGLAILGKNQNPTLEGLQALMDMQVKHEDREAKKAFTAAMDGLKASIPAVLHKDKTVDYMGGGQRVYYKHTSLASIMGVISAPMASHGLSVSWRTSTSQSGKVQVRCRITHRDCHYEESDPSDAPPEQKGGKNAVQAIASTMTLLQRYTLMAMLGLATADMTEPGAPDESPEPSRPDGVDQGRNLVAIKTIRKHGLSIADAEAKVGRPSSEWTSPDLDTVRTWIVDEVKARAVPETEPEPETNNGELTEEEELELEGQETESYALESE